MAKNFTISDTDLQELVHIQKETRSGQYICDCVFCGKPSHMYINKRTQMFDCKKCGEYGSIYKLLKHLDKLYLAGDKSVELTPTIKSIRQTLEDKIEEQTQDIPELPVKSMPAGWRICIGNKYLLGRNITTADCKRYKIGETRSMFKYRDYILIPIYDNGEIRGYIGRYGAKKVPDGRLRYNNSLDTEFANLLYGYDDIICGETETVIIVEGVFDKIAVDRHLSLFDDNLVRCVCTFGKKISDIQIRKLIDKRISNVVLMYDYDALKEIKKYGLELNEYFNTLIGVCTIKKDIDECNREEALQVFENLKPVRQFNVDIIGKLKH